MKHEIVRLRHATRRRRLTVRTVSLVTPGMVRVVLEGPELEGFASAGFDDHVKLFLPGEAEPLRRDYTPRRHDAEAGTLALDFAIHEAGPATRWAMEAKLGDGLEIGGPRGSVVVSDSFDWWLMIGDETALPAIGRRVEEAAPGARLLTLVAVTGPEEEQRFDTAGDHRAHWVHRPEERAADPEPLLDALAKLDWPEGEGFVWIAAEAGVTKALRAHVLDIRGHPKQWLRASGYWLAEVADAHVRTEV
ncbi:siderophore-interacting protein [Amaricoccus solimangrovi]|uniref:Siderophore-interacting protein n=1 Tax=Amaricoccus solimangrovi TaxID=2589815 RepID=A0A501WDK4_9RHOB|nr:siderophore-interacting protein [Amaricoccus solimangrovi]TPE47468.1 siderophore-interacting protein [Amaricoccus solimangrovi]